MLLELGLVSVMMENNETENREGCNGVKDDLNTVPKFISDETNKLKRVFNTREEILTESSGTFVFLL